MRYRTPHGQTYGQLYGLGSAGRAYHPHHACPPGTVQRCRPATAEEVAAKQAALDARAAALATAIATGDWSAQYMGTGDDRVSGDRFCECVPAPGAGVSPREPSADVSVPRYPGSTAGGATGGVSWLVVAAIGIGALGVGLALRR